LEEDDEDDDNPWMENNFAKLDAFPPTRAGDVVENVENDDDDDDDDDDSDVELLFVDTAAAATTTTATALAGTLVSRYY